MSVRARLRQIKMKMYSFGNCFNFKTILNCLIGARGSRAQSRQCGNAHEKCLIRLFIYQHFPQVDNLQLLNK